MKKNQQVKFLASDPEVENIKVYAELAGLSQSEFIRTAIREKIRQMDAQSRSQGEDRYELNPEDKLRLVELTNIRRALEQIEHEKNTLE